MSGDSPPEGLKSVERHRTALSRTALSRPVARVLFDGLLAEESSFFDYGCGRGGDVTRLKEMGYEVSGFDPNYAPDVQPVPSAVVNLGFVVNVIEDPDERAQVLRKAWDLTQDLLVVSARLLDESRGLEGTECSDGILTDRNTFQKFYEQNELKNWIDRNLGVEPIAAEPGVFYVFRRPAQAQLYLLTRIRRANPAPRKSEAVFAEHQELLEEFMGFYEELGRLPRAGEFSREAELRQHVGTPRQAFRVVLNVTGEEQWDRIRVARYEDLLVYLALSGFRRRPRLSDLPTTLKLDIKDFFGNYKSACEQADRALHAISDQARIKEAIRSTSIGKRLPSALYVHSSAIPELPVILRVLDGCAQEILGAVSADSIVKFDSERPRLVYLDYPDFDRDAHPALEGAFSVNLKTLRSNFADYSKRKNPPILHRKEAFVSATYPGRGQFAALTEQEIQAGLFSDPSRIGMRDQWIEIVESAGLKITGHELKLS